MNLTVSNITVSDLAHICLLSKVNFCRGAREFWTLARELGS